jgi:hypothetical protein
MRIAGNVLLTVTLLIAAGPSAFADDKAGGEATTRPTILLGTSTNWQFVPPPDDAWEPIKQQSPTISGFVSRKHDAVMALQLLPPKVVIDEKYGDAVTKQLKEEHQRKKAKIVMEPTIESDGRFVLVVREKFEPPAKAGQKQDDAQATKVAEQLHLYRAVGPRVVECTINTVAEDADTVKAEQTAAQEALLSVTPPGAKSPVRKPATQPKR